MDLLWQILNNNNNNSKKKYANTVTHYSFIGRNMLMVRSFQNLVYYWGILWRTFFFKFFFASLVIRCTPHEKRVTSTMYEDSVVVLLPWEAINTPTFFYDYNPSCALCTYPFQAISFASLLNFLMTKSHWKHWVLLHWVLNCPHWSHSVGH